MAVPKKRKSKQRKTPIQAAKLPDIVKCTNCSDSKLQHRVCDTCGHYGNIKVFEGRMQKLKKQGKNFNSN